MAPRSSHRTLALSILTFALTVIISIPILPTRAATAQRLPPAPPETPGSAP